MKTLITNTNKRIKGLIIKNPSALIILFMLFWINNAFSQIYSGAEAEKIITGSSYIYINNILETPAYVRFRKNKEIPFTEFDIWMKKNIGLSDDLSLRLLNKETDKFKNIHYRLQQLYKGIPVEFSYIIVHTFENKITSFNGTIIKSISVSATPAVDIEEASAISLKYCFGNDYDQFKNCCNQPDDPIVIIPKNLNFKTKSEHSLSYKLDVYSKSPLMRKFVYVDANTGEIEGVVDRIQTDDTTGIANTFYSGQQSIKTNFTGNNFILRESGRGNGINTIDYYNFEATDFTDDDNYWNNINPQHDEVATDAHWAAEKTYDYFLSKFGRNSIDNNGYAINSYVHYGINFDGAFWDGDKVWFGDGNGSNTPFVTVDVCAHEISHGLTTKTASLVYQDEPGALNEGFSDIFGTCIEFYAKPAVANWLIADETGTALRSLNDPKSLGYPDTYYGLNWDYMNEVHKNSTVLSHWFYLLSQGGNGTNDNGNNYSVAGIGIEEAAEIAYRTLTIYLLPLSNYNDVHFYSILAASDLFGACSAESQAVINAWYAVGIGSPFTNQVESNFSSPYTTSCQIPASIPFTNLSSNSDSCLWDFGDGTFSNEINPVHIYNSFGNYNVKLISYGNNNCIDNDTLLKANFIQISSLAPCVALMPESGNGETQISCSGTLFDSGGAGYYQSNTRSTITISPVNAEKITLTFEELYFEAYYWDGIMTSKVDSLIIFDGPDTLSPVLSVLSGYDTTAIPIVFTGNSVTILQSTNATVNRPGFKLSWDCSLYSNYEELNKSTYYSLFPNPAQDYAMLSVPRQSIIEIYDTQNRMLQSLPSSEENIKLDLSAFSKGFFVIKIISAQGTFIKKLIKL